MTLSERIAHCRVEGCRRAPIKDGSRCVEHRITWLPEWRRRQLEDAALRGRVATKELA